MKNFIVTLVFTITCAPVLAIAADNKKEEQCQKDVTAALEALEASSEKQGKEVKLKDLSALDIMNIAKAKGSCAASEEISRRQK